MQTIILDSRAFIEVFMLGAVAFLAAMVWTPLLTSFLYRNRIGKRIRQTDYRGESAPIFAKLHQGKENTPTMGGVLVWVTTAVVTFFFNFSRSGTWLPLFSLVATGIVGGIDDLFNIRGIGPHRGGLRFGTKLGIYLGIAAAGAWWFYDKLDWASRPFHIPGVGDMILGWWYIPLFILVLVGMAFAVNETDGLDGLAGGLLMLGFASYTIIALSQGNLPLAKFCATITGALLAFLWFNIYPARFFMGDTGSMALGMTLAVIAFLTNSVIPLFFIGFVFILEAASALLQIFSKRFLGRKIFLSAPIHHHFEAKGWPETKVTMRFWVLGAVFSSIGIAIALLGRG